MLPLDEPKPCEAKRSGISQHPRETIKQLYPLCRVMTLHFATPSWCVDLRSSVLPDIYRGQPGGQKIGLGLPRLRPWRMWRFKLGLSVSRGRRAPSTTMLDADHHAHSV